jgi:hypothetical protein
MRCGRKLERHLWWSKVEELLYPQVAWNANEPFIDFACACSQGRRKVGGGENAKFGLSTAELVAASDLLTVRPG